MSEVTFLKSEQVHPANKFLTADRLAQLVVALIYFVLFSLFGSHLNCKSALDSVGTSCPAIWKYPIRCPERVNFISNKTRACCYDNGPNCCEQGGNRCVDKGSDVRDYCPRPGDEKKLVHCCIKENVPSCCCSRGWSSTVR